MEKTGRLRWKRWLSLLFVVVLIAGYGAWALKRPLLQLIPGQAVAQVQAKTPASTLAWPPAGQAAVGIAGSQIMQANGAQTPLPIASTAKLITALSVLQKKPLKPGQQGPAITLTDADVALYNSYMARNGSVMRVVAGEQISEYQTLQAIMLPSANNVADSLAIWAFGSLDNYAAYANKYVAQLGLHNTHIGTDASGLAPSTTSTAQDLVKLGEAAMQNPVLAQIAGQPTATGLPIVNNIKNVNFLLGTDNIVGIKTGNTEEAGGVFVGAAKTTVNNKPVIIVTAVSASPSLFAAMKDSLNLIRSAQTNFKPVTVVNAGTVAGSYKVPWGGSIPATATGNLNTTSWAGSTVTANIYLKNISADSKAGQSAGSVRISKSALTDEKSVAVKLQGAPTKPSAWWRLTHPLQ
jgi:D-alanyl-D-alanine carboxypeptidase (penicillin-binding protein 5/6)